MGTYKVTVELNDQKQAVVKARDQQIISDTIPQFGGTGEGVTPPELLIGALGACQLITAKLYAKKFGVDLQHLAIELEGTSEKPDETVGLISQIKVNTVVESNSPEEKVREFLEFVEKNCLIANTLLNQIQISREHVTVKKPVVK